MDPINVDFGNKTVMPETPKGSTVKKVIVSFLLTLVLGAVVYYFMLPPLNFKAIELQKPIFKNGECVYTRLTTDQIRDYCAAQLELQWDEVKRFENPHNYYVDLSQKLWDCKHDMLKASKTD